MVKKIARLRRESPKLLPPFSRLPPEMAGGEREEVWLAGVRETKRAAATVVTATRRREIRNSDLDVQ
jgi:hypothetical protein